jgi:hypothetical protein
MGDLNPFILYLKGRASKRLHLMITFSLLGIFGLLLIICATFYNTPFNFRDVCISNLGNPTLNGRAWWLFSVDFIFGSFIMWVHSSYIYHHLPNSPKYFNKIWLFLMRVTCFGMVAISIVNETNFTYHYFLAFFAFGGIGLATFFSILHLIIRFIQTRSWKLGSLFNLFILLFIVCLIIIVKEVLTYGIVIPSDLNFTEWIAFFGLLIWIVGLFFILPEKNA